MPSQAKGWKNLTKIEVFSIHGHITDGRVDYNKLLRLIGSLSRTSLSKRVADRFIVVVPLSFRDGVLSFAAYSGLVETNFLILDLNSNAEEVGALAPGKAIVRKTLGVIDASRREAAIQFVYHGPRAQQIAELFEEAVRKNSTDEFREISLEFAPVAGGEFFDQLEQMSRIQSAHLKLTRPNYDWEQYGNIFSDLGQESDARNLEISATANRNGSLNKNSGVIRLIKDLNRKRKSIFKGASIIGSLGDGGQLITLNLERHIESVQVEIPVRDDGRPNQEALVQRIGNVLESRGPNNEEL